MRFCPSWLLGICLLTAAQAAPPRGERTVNFSVSVPADSAGFSAILGGANPLPKLADEAEPNVPDALGIGFDLLNPKTEDPFSKDGNVYDRPQREVSLHWNGREVANRPCPTDIKGRARAIRVSAESTFGGALITVKVDKATVYDRFFVEGVEPEASQWRFVGNGSVSSARTSAAGTMKVDAPTIVPVFTKDLNNAAHHRVTRKVSFRGIPGDVGRVVARLKLEPTPQGVDRWDRLAQVFLKDSNGRDWELLRYITPYRRGGEWTLDVTDMLPLFRGWPTAELVCETWAEGWLVSLDLAFYPGVPEFVPTELVPLWNGSTPIGLREPAPSAFFVPKTVEFTAVPDKVAVRTVVTGHGQLPNFDNAAEFIPLSRTLAVNGKPFTNLLWKEDVYLNPIRPQGGSWKWDRAGWAPGDVVTPWTPDITRALKPGKNVFTYEIQKYENKTPDMGNISRHVVSSALVVYRRAR